MYGHNGIAALWGPTEHNNGTGIGLYLWKDSVLTTLRSVSLAIAYNSWVWMSISFVEGEIRVLTRSDGVPAWTERIALMRWTA